MHTSPIIFEQHIDVDAQGQTAIEILSSHCPSISKQKLKLAMKYGAVWLSDAKANSKTIRLRRAKRVITSGSKMHIYYNEDILFGDIKPAHLIADLEGYSVWNKPSGMFSQGTKWGDHSSITRWIELFGFGLEGIEPRETFIVHRLDRATNGLILVAHSKLLVQKLTELFETRKISKTYSAVVAGEFPSHLYSEITENIDGRSACTKIISSAFNSDNNISTLSLLLETGRKHQIRKHLCSIGFPILNDQLYGQQNLRETKLPDQVNELRPDLMLRSNIIQLQCPISGELKDFSILGY